MRMNSLEKWVMNSPMRRLALRFTVAPLLRKIGGTLRGATVLEIGCGEGFGTDMILRLFHAQKVIAVDLDENMVRRARRRLAAYGPDRLELIVGDAATLQERVGSVDAVFDFGALHHMPNWQQVLAGLVAFVRPGGKFFFEEACRKWIRRWPYRRLFDHPQTNRFNAKELVRELERNGVAVGSGYALRQRGDFVLGVGTRHAQDAGASITMASGQASRCPICGHRAPRIDDSEVGWVRGNTGRFCHRQFPVWKCPDCETIQSLEEVDMADIYSDYPLNERCADLFARQTMGNLLGRIKKAGLRRDDTILDYGCGNGLFLQFLETRGYGAVVGYDPYVPGYRDKDVLERSYDCVIANDVVEHTEDPRRILAECTQRVKAGGLLYVGMPESDGVDPAQCESHILRLHQPFHRVILSRANLLNLALETGPLEVVATYTRSYLDTRIPFVNYRFLDEFSRAHGYDMDRAMSKDAWRAFLEKPSLLGYGIGGYWIPSAFEPAAILRKTVRDGASVTKPGGHRCP